MHSKALAVVLLLAACGGASTTGASWRGDAGSPPEATVLQAGTYQATAAGTSHSLVAPVGPAMTTTLITDWSGSVSMVLPNYDFVRGSLRVNKDGTLSVGTGNVLAHQDGRIEPAVIVGTSVGTTIAATVNGQPFSVALTDIAAQDFAVSKMAGAYLSTSASTGTWILLYVNADGSIEGWAFASQSDCCIATRAIGHYLGSIGAISCPAGPSTCDPTANFNVFNFGLALEDAPYTGAGRHAGTYGFAYFTAAGLVGLTVNPVTGEQLTATFAKQ